MNTGAHTSPDGGETRSDGTRSDEARSDEAPAEASADRTSGRVADEVSSDPIEGELVMDVAAEGAGSTDETIPPGEAADGHVDAVDGPSGEQGPDERLAAAEARADENWDRLLRLQAEMENQRKRAQRDVAAARKFALEGIVGDLLPVHDSLEMGLAAAGENGATMESLREGSELTLKMLGSALERHNVVAIDPVGEKFDPAFHQAMTMQPVEGVAPNTVVSVMQKGYTLNDRLVRPALVMVAK